MRFFKRDTASFQTLHSSVGDSTTSHTAPALPLDAMDQHSTRHKSTTMEENGGRTSTDTDHDLILCATRGRIYAVHKQDGSRLWEKKFPKEKSDWCGGGTGVISLFITDDNKYILAGKNAKVACLDIITGDTRWVKKLPVSESDVGDTSS